jgi:hypothetical protein
MGRKKRIALCLGILVLCGTFAFAIRILKDLERFD